VLRCEISEVNAKSFLLQMYSLLIQKDFHGEVIILQV